MKGVILAGGTGSRLFPITSVTNKHLLPVFNKPMIFYPLHTLKEAGITEVMIITGPDHSGSFLNLLGSGRNFGMQISYDIQTEPGGIPQALGLAEKFVNGEKVVVILGDNIYEDNLSKFVEDFSKKDEGATILLKSVEKPQAYGVAVMEDNKILKIVEKPKEFISDLAVTGCYMYDNTVFDVIRGLKPSARNELEVSELNSHFLNKGNLSYNILENFWGDCGESFEMLLQVCNLISTNRLATINPKLDNSRVHSNINSAVSNSVPVAKQ